MKRIIKFVAFTLAVVSPMLATDVALLSNGFSIRHDRRETVGSMTRLYFGADDSAGYVDVPTQQIAAIETETPAPAVQPELKAANTDDVVATASNKSGIDPDLISSVIQAESGFNAHAISRKGAQGLMQLMPATAAHLGVRNVFDPHENVQGGSMYLRDLLIQNHLDLARALDAVPGPSLDSFCPRSLLGWAQPRKIRASPALCWPAAPAPFTSRKVPFGPFPPTWAESPRADSPAS